MKKEELPKIIPIFPLSNFIIFPKTTVPLNIFEPRYIDMINESMKSKKLIGMIQPLNFNNVDKLQPNLHQVGCLGKITSFKETEDGRYLIELRGLIRFEILNEIKTNKLYREFKVDYKMFEDDLSITSCETKTDNLMDKAKVFFKRSGLLLNWKEFEKLSQNQKINTLAMIAPITNEEKQKILETVTLKEKIGILNEIIIFYLHEISFNNQTIQ